MSIGTLGLVAAAGAAVFVGWVAHDGAQAVAAARLGDGTERRWGRRRFDLRRDADPFGTVILPMIGLGLLAAGSPIPVFAYGRTVPVDASGPGGRSRSEVLVTLAGPAANLLLAFTAGVVLRGGTEGPAADVAVAVLWVNATMAVIQLMPVPGLDGSRLLRRFLPPRAAEVYAGLDAYLPLFILALFFVLSGSFLGIVRALTSALCAALAGVQVC